MISCDKVRRVLPLHAGGDLRGRQEHEIDEHLSTCLGCYRLYQEYLEGVARLRASREPFEVAPEFWAKLEDDVLARVREEAPAPTSSLRWSVYRPLILAAASFLMALTAWFAFEDSSLDGPEPFSTPPVASGEQHIVPILDSSVGPGLENVGVRRSVSTRQEGEIYRLMRQLDHPDGPEDLYELERLLGEYSSDSDDGIYR